MSKYFDKDFFRFFWGFIAIIAFSMILIMAGRFYEERAQSQTANIYDSVENR